MKMKPFKYAIRPVTEQDLDQIADLYALFWNETMNVVKMRKTFTRIKNNSQYIFLCADIDGEIIGTIQGIICDELYGECQPFMVMENFVVKESHRSMGFGKALLKELERAGKEHQCTQIVFITESNRENTIRFYEKLGFSSTSHIGFKRSLR